jgi:hypothetical protein
MKSTILTLFCLCYITATGQTLEQQLLNQLHSTTNTSASDANKWTKIAECTINSAYQDLGGVFDFLGTGSSGTNILYGRIIARFKNQNPTITEPNRINLILSDSNLETKNVKAIINEANIQLFIKIPITYTTIWFRQTLKSNNGAMTALSNQPFLANLPSGTAINCQEGNSPAGTVNDFEFNDESPVNGANIVYNATFSDANKLRNIIVLRNLASASTSTALRQCGIHFSVSQEITTTDSRKSAQILLETKSTYANGPALNFYTANQKRLAILHSGNIGIGTETPREKLEVAGVIRATEVKVMSATADFVFDPDYDLRPLQEVETFIKQNKHRPDIPSAAQMEQDGIGLAEMNKLLLQKVEELTLYIIELKKEIEDMKK